MYAPDRLQLLCLILSPFLGGVTLNAGPDMWRWTRSSRQWQWLSGALAGNIFPAYFSRGSPSPGTTPGTRQFSGTVLDSSSNLLMLWGGQNQMRKELLRI